ncbi:hypothetical protein OAF54_00750 [bacterium]|nr:hypothetical protein [bacterium]
MIDLATELKSVWYLIMGLIGLSVWLVRLEAISKQSAKIAEENRKAIGAAFEKIDVINETLPVMKSKLNVHGDLLKPDKLAEHYTMTATFQAETKKDLERLLEAARKAGVF